MAAYEQLTDCSRAFGLIADVRSGSLADWRYTALDSLDAIWHELDEPDDPEQTIADIETRAAALTDRIDECDCPWSTH